MLMVWRSFWYGWYFEPSAAPLGWLLGGPFRALCSLDQTARFLLAAATPSRPWPKQVRASCGKCPSATTTHHSHAASETTTYRQHRSRAPRLVGTARPDMETS